jgi:hypothetical protein
MSDSNVTRHQCVPQPTHCSANFGTRLIIVFVCLQRQKVAPPLDHEVVLSDTDDEAPAGAPPAKAAPAQQLEAPVEPETLPEGEAFDDACAAGVKPEEVVSEKDLIELVNKVMRKDKNNQFRFMPHQSESKLNQKTVRATLGLAGCT